MTNPAFDNLTTAEIAMRRDNILAAMPDLPMRDRLDAANTVAAMNEEIERRWQASRPEHVTTAYENAHGRKPRGTANWAFVAAEGTSVSDRYGEVVFAHGPYKTAKRIAAARLEHANGTPAEYIHTLS